jgi:large subunit ribosomal protein L32
MLKNTNGGNKVPNPKRKHTPHRRDCRRSANSKLDMPNLSKCSNCGIAKMPHNVCLNCGFYNDKFVMSKKAGKFIEVSKKEYQEQEVNKQ